MGHLSLKGLKPMFEVNPFMVGLNMEHEDYRVPTKVGTIEILCTTLYVSFMCTNGY